MQFSPQIIEFRLKFRSNDINHIPMSQTGLEPHPDNFFGDMCAMLLQVKLGANILIGACNATIQIDKSKEKKFRIKIKETFFEEIDNCFKTINEDDEFDDTTTSGKVANVFVRCNIEQNPQSWDQFSQNSTLDKIVALCSGQKSCNLRVVEFSYERKL